MLRRVRRRSRLGRLSTTLGVGFISSSLVLASVGFAMIAQADVPTCGLSGSHTICISVTGTTLTGNALVTVTNSPNDGLVYFHWTGAPGKAYSDIMTDFAPSPETGDYSFTWPTGSYKNAAGELQARAGATSAAPVSVPITLSNPPFVPQTDWANYVPSATWIDTSDPHVLAVGDGPSDEVSSNAVAEYITSRTPPVVLFLGDIYEHASYTTALNHYGVSNMDVPAGGTLWGSFANVTQPTFGNHEKPVKGQWRDEWHGRPLWMSFTFGNVLFLNLDSSAPMDIGSEQYQFVLDTLAAPGVPPCIVSYWHIPPVQGSSITAGQSDLWTYLTDHGGDLVLNGHVHHMHQTVPLNDLLQPAADSDPQMTDLVSGAGGHALSPAHTSGLIDWARGHTAGVLDLTLPGAALGGAPTSLSWQFLDTSGGVLHSGSTSC